MNHAQNDNPGAGDAEDGAIGAVDQRTVGCAEDFVLGNAGAAFGKSLQRGDLLFGRQNKGFGDDTPLGAQLSAECSAILPDVRGVNLPSTLASHPHQCKTDARQLTTEQ